MNTLDKGNKSTCMVDQLPHEFVIPSADTLEFTSRLIEHKLKEFGVEVKVVAAYPGPVITRYQIERAVGVKESLIINLIKDLARSMSVASIRGAEAILGKAYMARGKAYMALEVPNPKRKAAKL